MSTKKEKARKKKKEEPKEEVQQKKTEQKEEAKKEVKLDVVSYNPKEEGSPQAVRDYGKDKHSRNTYAMELVFRYLIANKGMEKIHAEDVIDLVQDITGKDFKALYKRSWADSPIHRGAHALSKPETDNPSEKDGQKVDDFARKQRAFIFKTSKVGPAQKNGFYLPNPQLEYEKVEEQDLRNALEEMVQNCPRCQKAE